MTHANSIAPADAATSGANARYAKCIESSKRARWDIDSDVIRDREFDFERRFLPDGLSQVNRLGFLSADEQRFLSQIQGRTYANMFGLVERFIGIKTLELGGRHGMGDQVAMEALVRMTDEELKHQALFRRLELMMAEQMPPGYTFVPEPNAVASLVLGKCDWAVLALTLHIELFTLAHYRASIEHDDSLSELWRDVFRFHWMEESQHAVLDELEWRREHERLDSQARDDGVAQFIDLVAAVDGLLAAQARRDVDYFIANAGRGRWTSDELRSLHDGTLRAYRWQYIVSGAQEPRFVSVLEALTTEAQMRRILGALGPIVAHGGAGGAQAH